MSYLCPCVLKGFSDDFELLYFIMLKIYKLMRVEKNDLNSFVTHNLIAVITRDIFRMGFNKLADLKAISIS